MPLIEIFIIFFLMIYVEILYIFSKYKKIIVNRIYGELEYFLNLILTL